MKILKSLSREQIDSLIIIGFALVLLFGAALAGHVQIQRYVLIGLLVVSAAAIILLARSRKGARKVFAGFNGVSRVWAVVLVILFAGACLAYVAGAIAIARKNPSTHDLSLVFWSVAAFIACGALMSLPLGRKRI